MKVLVLNPGATSTKVAVFDEEKEIFRQNIDHPAGDLAQFAHVVDQTAFRRQVLLDAITKAGFTMANFDAVCGRGGLLRHIPSGTYGVNSQVLEDIAHPPYGEHAANLGAILAKELADTAGIPAYFVDPVCVDELSDVARISGFEGMERESFFHALNQKSIARKAARQLGRPYEALNLIVVHMGGGVSVAAHKKGRVVDNFNVKDDGAMGMDRAGSLPVNAVINFCFSGKTKAEVKQILGSRAGVFSYLGTKDFREVQERARQGEEKAKLIYEAFGYQLAKDMGAMAAVLEFQVDAVVLTGGIAYSDAFCSLLERYVSRLAPVLRLPGEEEMRALAEGALRVLHGEPVKEYDPK